MSSVRKQIVYVGTYTHADEQQAGRSEGIFSYEFDPASGTLIFLSATADVGNPSFLALTADRRFLVAVNEFADGAVSTFAIDPLTHQLAFLNRQSTHGMHPCYVSLDQAGKWVFVANYSSGNISVLPLSADGRLGEASDVVQHHGHSVDPLRQDAAHAHSVRFDPAQRYVLAADLGVDRIFIYNFDPVAGRLRAQTPAAIPAAPGAGPRHFEFHPNGPFLYVINELSSTIMVYEVNGERATFDPVQTISTLPNDFDGVRMAAALHIARSGRFLYASNRGHDSITVFAIDKANGQLALLEFVSTGGQTPRDFEFDLSGNYLLAANQDSGTVTIFHIDDMAGRLTQTGQVISLPSPVHLCFMTMD